MKNVKFIIVFFMLTSVVFSRTIVWKPVASLPEGFYFGEAVALYYLET